MAATPAGGWPANLRTADVRDMVAIATGVAGATGSVVAVVLRWRRRRREERHRRQLEREALLAACEALGAVLEILDEPLSTLLPDDRRRRIAVARVEIARASRAYRLALRLPARPLSLLDLDEQAEGQAELEHAGGVS
jgi:hypothetical protein